MAKAKELEFSIETPAGVFDIATIAKDKKEMDVLSALKNDLLKEGKFPDPKPGRICLNSISAFIIYLDSINEICDTTNDTGSIH